MSQRQQALSLATAVVKALNGASGTVAGNVGK